MNTDKASTTGVSPVFLPCPDTVKMPVLLLSYLCSSVFICGLFAFNSAFAQTTAPAGLDSLSEERLMNELAARGLSTLLDRAFEANKIPAAERDSRRAV